MDKLLAAEIEEIQSNEDAESTHTVVDRNEIVGDGLEVQSNASGDGELRPLQVKGATSSVDDCLDRVLSQVEILMGDLIKLMQSVDSGIPVS